MKNKKNIELLAPAGNIDKMKTAFTYGADAVYLGLADFSLRVRINFFDTPKIRQAVKYAHERNKKVYVTINIFPHNKHFKKLPAYIKKIKEMGVDALIISDAGVVEVVKKMWAKAEIHLSTQANCINTESARFWYKSGVKRVILGREVALDDIKKIKKEIPKLELEYFVHGAMCMSYSGRCFLSQYFLGRSANLGDCVQPCRWKYNIETHNEKRFFITEEKRPNNPLEIEEDDQGSYILNSKDLCLVEHLKDLKDAGVSSFKIEGRNKSIYYLANVCGIYRDAIDCLGKNNCDFKKRVKFLKKELEEKLVNRGYTSGFLLGETADQNIEDSHVKSGWEFCGQIIGRDKKGLIKIRVHNTLKQGDVVEIVNPSYDVIKIKIGKMWKAENEEEMTEAHGGGSGHVVLLEVGEELPQGTVLRRKIN
ncbi:U32 family peptidase C-terminal domain-containing protein [bacterium]|nr:U32 family peptidase C-terminal domain-containing protein [bacterium]